MPTYLVMHVQPGGFKAGAETLGSQSGVYALSALSNVTAKKVKRNPPTFTVEDL
jgi:hypothetical protein